MQDPPQYHCRRSVPRDAALTQQHGFQPGTKQHNQKATRRGYCSYCCYYWPLRDGSPSQSPPSCVAAKAVTAAAEDHAAKIKLLHGEIPVHLLGGAATEYDHAAPGVLPPLSSAGIPLRRTHPNRELASGIT